MRTLSLVLKKHTRLIVTSGFLASLCVGLILIRIIISGTTFNGAVYYWFLNWNLFLALLPLGFAVLALEATRARVAIMLGLVALAFLPNAFYVVTDFIHLNEFQASGENVGVNIVLSESPEYVGPGILFDSVLLFIYSAVSAFFGAAAIEALRLKVRQYAGAATTWAIVAAGMALSAFAIYLGRVLRWNSWDFLADPLGLLADIIDIIVHPVSNSQAWGITGLFCLMIVACYGIYKGSKHL